MNNTNIPRRRIFVTWMLALAWLVSDALAVGSTGTMKEFRFPIDGYELSFSLPKAFLADYWGNVDDARSELVVGNRPSEGTAAILFSHVHMLTGPIWVGNYAATDFVVMVVEADAAFSGQTSSLEQLESYKKWQFATSNSYERYESSRKPLGGESWLLLTRIRGDTARTDRRADENFLLCFPLAERRFLQVACRIKEYVPGKTSRWLADAHRMRDQILNSVVVRKTTK